MIKLVKLCGIEGSTCVYFLSLVERHPRWQNRQNISNIEKRAIKLKLLKPKITSCEPFFKQIKILTVPLLYIYETIVLVKSYNLIQGQTYG